MECGWPHIIVHADMDAFYAAVEQRDNPALRGKPVLIGPNSNRGVVLTASYEARPYGVGSAMPVAEARRKCPHAIMVRPRLDYYQQVSAQIMDVFADFSPSVEALSLDEAFLDMSGAEHFFGSPMEMAHKIKTAVWQATQLNISVGVSGTKYVAKVASAHDKPNGLTVVPPDVAKQWLAPLPVSRLWGAGKKTVPRLHALGLHTIGDIAALDEHQLVCKLGAVGRHFYSLANARDPRRVLRGRAAKSIGSDRTLSHDITDHAEILLHLRRAAERIARRIRKKQYVACGLRIRLKTTRFEMLTRQRHLSTPTDTAADLFHAAEQLLKRFDHPGPFRLVGMAVFDLHWRAAPLQMDLFTNGELRRLETTVDALTQRFGQDTVIRAKDLTASGSVAKNGVNLDFLDFRDGERVTRPG
jgi:DNA polymerase IV